MMKSKYIIKVIAIMSFLTVNSSSFVNGQNVEKHVRKMVNDIRTNGFAELNEITIDEGNSSVLLTELSKHLNDPLKEVRHATMIMLYQIAEQSEDQKMVEEVVGILAVYCSDTEPLIWQQAARLLLTFSLSDFSETAKSSIKKLLSQGDVPRDFILLGGILGHKSEIEKLKRKYEDDDSEEYKLWYGKSIWACRLALARIGNDLEIDYVISQVVAEPNAVLRVTRLLKDLDYIKQAKAIEVIKGVLFSEERLPPVKRNDGIRHAQYALGLLAKSIEDFPIEGKGVGYTKEQLDGARQWMKQKSSYRIIR